MIRKLLLLLSVVLMGFTWWHMAPLYWCRAVHRTNYFLSLPFLVRGYAIDSCPSLLPRIGPYWPQYANLPPLSDWVRERLSAGQDAIGSRPNRQPTQWLRSWLRGAAPPPDTVTIPAWMPMMLAGLPLSLIVGFGPARRWRRKRRGLCAPCGYNLAGNESGVCPECGSEVKA